MKINCEFVQENLSAFVDSELSSDSANSIRAHLTECDICSRSVVRVRELNRLAGMIATPKKALPPWDSIDRKIASPTPVCSEIANQGCQAMIQPERSKPNWLTREIMAGTTLAVAVTVLIAFKAMLSTEIEHPFEAQSGLKHDSHPSLDLHAVIEQFRIDPRLALESLRDQFDLKEYTLSQADANLGRPTYVSNIKQTQGLPGNATTISTIVLSFPSCHCPFGECMCGEGGCNCIANVCQRPDGSVYLVFEQCKSQSIHLGDYPTEILHRRGQQLQQSIVDSFRTVSFDWETGKVVFIGLRNDDEIDSLFAFR